MLPPPQTALDKNKFTTCKVKLEFIGHSGKVNRNQAIYIFVFNNPVLQVWCCCFSNDGSTILSGSADKTLKLWRARGGSINTLNEHTAAVTTTSLSLGPHAIQVMCCCFSPDGSTILSGSADNTLKLWRTREGSLINTFNGHTDNVTTTSISS